MDIAEKCKADLKGVEKVMYLARTSPSAIEIDLASPVKKIGSIESEDGHSRMKVAVQMSSHEKTCRSIKIPIGSIFDRNRTDNKLARTIEIQK